MFDPPSALVAVVRDVSRAIGDCQLTHLDRTPIDFSRAVTEHAVYVDVLAQLGCTIERLPADETMPDSVFVEDTAIVVDEVAVMTRPGAPSRRHEVAGVKEVLAQHRLLVEIEAPGTVDGGDVVVAGRTVLVGRSSRTNEAGRAQLARMLGLFGYVTRTVSLRDCLHLKSAVTAIDDETLLVDPLWAALDDLGGFDVVRVDPREIGAANVLSVGRTLICSSRFPWTRDLLAARGRLMVTVPCDEIAKAEGAVTCCSLVFRRA